MTAPRSGRARTGRTGRSRPVLTGRALVLGGIVILLVVLLASPIQRYLGSRNDVSSAGQQLRHDQQQLAQLKRQQARWSDPGYIQQQARSRLQYAMPGDTVYVVVDKGQSSDIEKTAGKKAGPSSGPGWNDRLMNSIEQASK
jgi:cell division protein FtsB